MISNAATLTDLIRRLEAEPRVALDTEADSLHSYFEKICLLQLSTPGEDVLIDPLAGFDLQPLFDALNDKRIVFHGADYDLRLLHRVHTIRFEDLFDTMIAARLCGFKELGLAALVERFFQTKLSKASQKANWALRPLSRRMIEYAMNDTHYLLELEAILEGELRRLGRWDWFTQSRDRMAAAARVAKPRDENSAWRIPGSTALSPRAQSILRVLWQWRDSEARAWDRPPFHVMSSEDLLRIAESAASGRPPGAVRLGGQRRRSFEVVLALAMEIPESEWPKPERHRRKRPSSGYLDRLSQLRATRDRIAAELGLDSSIVAPRYALEATAEDSEAEVLMPWQRNLLGLGPRTGSVARAA